MAHDDSGEILFALNSFLADTAVVYLKTHGFHWNVEGENFYSLHLMLEKFYQELWESRDEIAERIRALGEKAPSNYVELLKNKTIQESEGSPESRVMLQILRKDYLALAKKAREISQLADKRGDVATSDMMIKKTAFLEKAVWMLQSSIIE